MPFLIRPYQKSDFEELWRIDQLCFEPQFAYSRLELGVYMRRSGSFTLVVEDQSEADKGARTPRILGFVTAEVRKRVGHVITIDVLADQRRGGLGSALLDAAEKKMLNAGASQVALETAVDNQAAIRFYKQKGYFVEKTLRGYYSGVLDAFLMRKDLSEVSS